MNRILPSGILALLLVQPVSAEGSSLLRGGPTSDALAAAVESRDSEALSSAWGGKIFELTGQYRGTPVEIDHQRIFDAVEGCNLDMKVEQSRDERGIVSWHCPNRQSSQGECYYETVGLRITILRFVQPEEALFFGVGSWYNDECGPVRPPTLEEAFGPEILKKLEQEGEQSDG